MEKLRIPITALSIPENIPSMKYNRFRNKRILAFHLLTGGSYNPLQIAKILLRNPLVLIPEMNLYFNHTSIEGSESSLDRQGNTAPDVIVQKVSITPEKFRNDVEALVGYIGEEHFISGLSIEVTLSELLAVISRKRGRKEAYDALAKYLSEERNILLTIKSSRKNDKDL